MHTPTKIAAACIAAAALLFTPKLATSTAPQQTLPPPIVTTTIAATTTTTTTIAAPPSDARCGAWWSLARQIGFTESMLPTLDRIIYRESRCNRKAFNPTDPNGGSHGLTQVNGFWCLPSRYYPAGYLQTLGVLDTCADLYKPRVALRATMALIEYSRSAGLCSWSQWAWFTPCED